MTPAFKEFIRQYHEETIRLFGPRPRESQREAFVREGLRSDSLHNSYCFTELGFYPPCLGRWGGEGGTGEGGTSYPGEGTGARARARLATLEEDLRDLQSVVRSKKVIVRPMLIAPVKKKGEKFTDYE